MDAAVALPQYPAAEQHRVGGGDHPADPDLFGVAGTAYVEGLPSLMRAAARHRHRLADLVRREELATDKRRPWWLEA